MASIRALSIDIADYRRDTAILTQEEKGAWLDLMIACAERGGELENDQSLLKFVSKLSTRAFRNFLPKFSQIFDQSEDGGWRNESVDYQLERIEKAALQRSEAGKRGMEKRWGKHNERYNEPITSVIAPVTPPDNERYNGTITNQNQNQILTETSKIPKPRPRARERRIPGKIETVLAADPKAGANGNDAPERSSGFRQVASKHVTPAKAALMSQCARYVGPEKAPAFWSAMLGPDANQVLSQTAQEMRASGWKDAG